MMFRRRIASECGFTMVELMVVIVIVAIVMALTIPSFLRAKDNAKNSAMRAVANDVTKALSKYNHDYPVIAPLNSWPPTQAQADCTSGCWDPLMRRNGTTRYPSRAAGSGVGVTWEPSSFRDPATGIVGQDGRPFIHEWPENPYGAAPVRIYRGAGSGTPYAGMVRVQRTPGGPYGAPLGSFLVTAWGVDKQKAVAVVYRRTVGAAAAATDCGYSPMPTCPGFG